jgi:hypothetical protein
MRWLLAGAAAVALTIVGVGCGSSTKTVTVTTDTEATTSVTESEGEGSATEPVAAVDHQAKSGGIEVSVSSAATKPTLDYVGGNYSADSPNAEHRTVEAPQGGHYVYVESEVLNEDTEGIDLTCGYPLKVKLRGAEGRRFDPVENLFEVKGNPECNEQLQPGFSHPMTWIFLVPPSAEVEALEFTDETKLGKPAAPAAVAVVVE